MRFLTILNTISLCDTLLKVLKLDTLLTPKPQKLLHFLEGGLYILIVLKLHFGAPERLGPGANCPFCPPFWAAQITDYTRAACGLQYKMDYTKVKETNTAMSRPPPYFDLLDLWPSLISVCVLIYVMFHSLQRLLHKMARKD